LGIINQSDSEDNGKYFNLDLNVGPNVDRMLENCFLTHTHSLPKQQKSDEGKAFVTTDTGAMGSISDVQRQQVPNSKVSVQRKGLFSTIAVPSKKEHSHMNLNDNGRSSSPTTEKLIANKDTLVKPNEEVSVFRSAAVQLVLVFTMLCAISF